MSDPLWDNYPPLSPGNHGLSYSGGWEDDEDPSLFLTEEDIQAMREHDLKKLEEFVNGKKTDNG